jgi:hypothetical protein
VPHRPIHRFEQSGTISDDKYIPRIREEFTLILVEQMRADGYVPLFDLDPVWTTSFDGRSYDFRLSVYGVYLGRKKAECVAGLYGNKEVPLTRNNRSEMLFNAQE